MVVVHRWNVANLLQGNFYGTPTNGNRIEETVVEVGWQAG